MSYFSQIAVDLIRDHGKSDTFFQSLSNCSVPRKLIAELHDTLVEQGEITALVELPEVEKESIRSVVKELYHNKKQAMELGKCVHVVRSIYEKK